MAQISDKNSTLHKQISIFQIMHAGNDQSSHNKRYFKKSQSHNERHFT